MSLLIVISINQLRNAGAHFYSQVTFEKLMLNKKIYIYIYIYIQHSASAKMMTIKIVIQKSIVVPSQVKCGTKIKVLTSLLLLI